MMALTREEVAKVEVGNTTIQPSTARWIVGIFLVVMSVPVIADVVVNGLRQSGESSAWSTLAAVPGQVRAALAAPGDPASAGVTLKIRAANRAVLSALRTFEDDLADQSPVFATLRSPAQSVLSDALGVGNERVYQGRDGWLFYRADVEFVIGAGFLNPGTMRRRQENEDRKSVV